MQGGRRKSLAISRAKVLHNNVAYFKKKLRDLDRASYEKVEPGDEEILEDPEQLDLDGVPSLLALRADRDAG